MKKMEEKSMEENIMEHEIDTKPEHYYGCTLNCGIKIAASTENSMIYVCPGKPQFFKL